MPMLAIAGPGGGAPIGAGFPTFNYNQAGHPAFALVGAGAAGAPTGCCSALTVAWFQNWNNVGILGYPVWVGVGGGGHAGVLANTVALHVGAGAWHVNLAGMMVPLGMAGFGGIVASNCRTVAAGIGGAVLSHQIGASKRTFLIVSGGGAAHAMGILESGGAAYFFDCNQGEAYFTTPQDCANWLVQNYLPAQYGGMATVHLIKD